ncbi:ankyrin repeat domain-containing protein [Gemmatimonadota bacterium]
MKCREARKLMTDRLIPGANIAPDQKLDEHLASCQDCSALLKENRRIIEKLTPEHEVQASTGFEERVMNQLEMLGNDAFNSGKIVKTGKKLRITIAVAAAVLLVITAGYLNWFSPQQGRGSLIISQAIAAEWSLINEKGIVHIRRSIVFYPVSDSMATRGRWTYLSSISPDGDVQAHQLILQKDPNLKVTFTEDSWFDSWARRFAIVARIDGDPVFVNSFNGSQFYTTSLGEDGKPAIVRESGVAFPWPEEFNRKFGAGQQVEKMLEFYEEENIREAGSGTLEDGTPVRLVRAESVGPDGEVITTCIIKVRKDNNTIVEIDRIKQGEKFSTQRYERWFNVEESSVRWDLGGIESLAQVPGAAIKYVVSKQDVRIRQLLDEVNFPAFVFSKPPDWAVENVITLVDYEWITGSDELLPKAVYRGGDDRHVVLTQSKSRSSLVTVLPRVAELVFTSRAGLKIWKTKNSEYGSRGSLLSAKAQFPDIGRPVDDRTGYLVTTPVGTVRLNLAVNGKLSGEELRTLAERLIMVEEYLGRKYIESGTVDPAGESGRLALIAAVGLGDKDKIRELVAAGVNLNAANQKNGMFPLWLAAARGDAGVVELLLSLGARVVRGEPSGRLPLFSAIDAGHAEVLRLLADAGADVDEVRKDGGRSIWYKAAFGDSAMVGALLAVGAEIETHNDDGMTPLMMAAKRGYTGVVKLLLATGADVNAQDNDGKSLLMHSMDMGEYVEVTSLLIAAGADVNARTPEGMSVLQHALEKNRTGVAALLKKAGARQ